PYAIAWDSTKVADGVHTLQARAYDAAGNSANSASVSVTVANASSKSTSGDTIAPTVSITQPTGGSFVARVVSVQIVASDNVGVSALTLSIDGKQVASTNNTSTLTYSWSVKWG